LRVAARVDGQGRTHGGGPGRRLQEKQLQLQDAPIYPAWPCEDGGAPPTGARAGGVLVGGGTHTHDEKRCITWRGRGPIADEVVMRVGFVRVGGRGDDGCVR